MTKKKTKEQEAKEAFKLHKEGIELGKGEISMALRAGRVYRDIKDNKCYEVLGCKTFTAYLADPDLTFQPSTIYAYMQVSKAVEEFKISPKIFDTLAINKFRMIIPHLTKENRDDLLHKAMANSYSDLRHFFVEGKKSEGFEDRKPMPKIFRCRACGLWIWDAVPNEICSCH